MADEDGSDPYEHPKKLGIFKTVESNNSLTTADIVQRIIRHKLEYETRNKKKETKELAVLEYLEKKEREGEKNDAVPEIPTA